MDYFVKKFYPLVPILIMGRSYTSDPLRRPARNLFDSWRDLLS